MSQEQIDYQEKTNPMAVIALVLAIIGMVNALVILCLSSLLGSITAFIFSIAGFILSLVARNKIKAEGGAPSQLKQANAALIIGIIGGVLSLISLAIAIIASLVFAGPAFENIFQNIVDQLESQ